MKTQTHKHPDTKIDQANSHTEIDNNKHFASLFHTYLSKHTNKQTYIHKHIQKLFHKEIHTNKNIHKHTTNTHRHTKTNNLTQQTKKCSYTRIHDKNNK